MPLGLADRAEMGTVQPVDDMAWAAGPLRTPLPDRVIERVIGRLPDSVHSRGIAAVLSGISVICFAATYTVTLLLEISRLFFRGRVRNAVLIGVAGAGFFAHTVYLTYQLRQLAAAQQPLLTWFTACLLFAWVLMLAYLAVFLLQRKSTAGLMLLPTCLVLIIVAHLFPSSHRAVQIWIMLHGLALLVGVALVVIGFSAGLMYLIQSYRLKQKLPPRSTIWLPSLERLQHINERCLLASVSMLGIGLVSGIMVNLIHSRSGLVIPWTDPVVVASLVWLAWLIIVVLFHAFYPPARQGRKVAYMTIGSFVFLGLVLGIIRWMPSQHTGDDSAAAAYSSRQVDTPASDPLGRIAAMPQVAGPDNNTAARLCDGYASRRRVV